MTTQLRSTGVVVGVLAIAAMVGACDTTTGPSESDLATDESVAVLSGLVTADTDDLSTDLNVSGIIVDIDGIDVSASTDSEGAFRLEVPGRTDGVTLRFQRGALTRSFEIGILAPGDRADLDVTLSPDGFRIRGTTYGRHVRFGGLAAFVSIEGEAPRRVLRLDVTRGSQAHTVDVYEGRTRFRRGAEISTFEDLVRAVTQDLRVEVIGEGVRQRGGVIAAARIHAGLLGDDPPHLIPFSGVAKFVSISGSPSQRTLRVQVVTPVTDGSLQPALLVPVDILEHRTLVHRRGELKDFDEILRAFDNDLTVLVRGRGVRQDDGALAAAVLLTNVREF